MFKNNTFKKFIYLITFIYFVTFSIITIHKLDEIDKKEPICSNIIKNIDIPDNFLFKVPYIFQKTFIKPKDIKHPTLIGNLQGEGIIQSITFATNYYGVVIGYSIDGSDIIWINNGNCLIDWGADSLNAKTLPVYLLYYKNKSDLAIAINTPLKFKKEIKIYFYNSSPDSKWIRSLHIYGYFKNLKPAKENKLNL